MRNTIRSAVWILSTASIVARAGDARNPRADTRRLAPSVVARAEEAPVPPPVAGVDAAAPLPAVANANARPQFVLAIERVAGYSSTSVKPDGNTSDSASGFTIGGPIHNPGSAPRVGFDYIFPEGITLGLGVGYASGSYGPADAVESVTYFLASPRVGYQFQLSPKFDLIGRGGLTFASGSYQQPDFRSCAFTPSQNCGTVTGAKFTGNYTSLSLEAVLVFRMTTSFNALGGLAYEAALSASGDDTRNRYNSSSTTTSGTYSGSASAVHLWLGLGGYL